MKKQIVLLVAVMFLSVVNAHAQTPPITITWTAELNCEYYPLDSVVVTNKSNGKTAVFYYPADTMLVYGNNVSINELPFTRNTLRVFPNPFSHSTQVEFSLAKYGEADLAVYDVLGREVLRRVSVLESGTHSYKLSLPSGFYTLRLQTAEGVRTARVVSEGKGSTALSRHSERSEEFVAKYTPPQPSPKGRENSPSFGGGWGEVSFGEVKGGLHKSTTDFPLNYGDTLVLQGFISVPNTIPSLKEYTVILTKDAHIIFAFYDACNCIMDTLKGEWAWIKVSHRSYYYDNLFTSTIKILSQNVDGSINYEVFAKDTLFSQGSFQIYSAPYMWCNDPSERIIDIKLPPLPYGIGIDSVSSMSFSNYLLGGGIVNYPYLRLWNCADDGLYYYYQKIK